MVSAKRKPKQKNVASSPAPAETTAASAAPAGKTIFTFVGFHVLSVLYEQVPSVPAKEGEQPPAENAQTQLSVNAGIAVTPEKIGQLRLNVTVTPNPRVQPYRIVVDALGTFSTEEGTPEDMLKFCRLAAPGIMFPYIREIIERTTSDGPHGPVRLAPINVSQMINQTPWSDVQPAQEPTAVRGHTPTR